MSDFLRVFEAKALATALTEAGHSVSERTVQRWKRGVTSPKAQDIRAIRELVGAILPDTTKAPPAEADGAELMRKWLERWDSPKAPKWAQNMKKDIVKEVTRLRGDSLTEAVRATLASQYADAGLREHESHTPDGQEPETSRPTPATRGPKRAKRP